MKLENLKTLLEKRGYIAEIFSSKEALCQRVLDEIDKNAIVGAGGSVTISQLDLLSKIAQKGSEVLAFGFTENSTPQEIMQKAKNSNIYLTSTNALSEDGHFVNIDGRGNRISQMCFGSEKVFYILGENKIVPTLSDALFRAQNVAAPQNAKRLNRKTPCATTGKCSDCTSPDRICKGTLIQTHPMSGQKSYVYILKETLGY